LLGRNGYFSFQAESEWTTAKERFEKSLLGEIAGVWGETVK
jgi:hypothetical protein